MGPAIINDSPWNNDCDILITSFPGPGAEDREVRCLDRTKTTQRTMTGTGMSLADSDKYITYSE